MNAIQRQNGVPPIRIDGEFFKQISLTPNSPEINFAQKRQEKMRLEKRASGIQQMEHRRTRFQCQMGWRCAAMSAIQKAKMKWKGEFYWLGAALKGLIKN